VNEFRVGFIRSYSFAEQDPFGRIKLTGTCRACRKIHRCRRISQISLTNSLSSDRPTFLPKQQVPQQYQWVNTLSKTAESTP